MKKILLALVAIVGFTAFSFGQAATEESNDKNLRQDKKLNGVNVQKMTPATINKTNISSGDVIPLENVSKKESAVKIEEENNNAIKEEETTEE